MAWKATKKEMDVVQYNYDNYEARKENFKVEKIIFVSFHAEGVGTVEVETRSCDQLTLLGLVP